MISRRVLNETDFSCSDGIAQNKARSDCFCLLYFLFIACVASDNTIILLVAVFRISNYVSCRKQP